MSATTPTAKAAAKQLAEHLGRWRAEPERFPLEAFEQPPEMAAWQMGSLAATATHDRIAVKSGHGVGKSTELSIIILLGLVTHHPIKIPCTAPSAHQLEDVLWAELAQWHRRLHPWLRKLFNFKQGKVEAAWAPNESFAVARTARREQPEAFQGFHAKHLWFVADEASGVDDLVFEVASGAMSTPGAKTFLRGNPTRTSGYFYDCFHPTAGMKPWRTSTVSCFDVAGVSWADPGYPAEVAGRYGEDSNVYRVRVLGEFPRQDDDTVIPLDLIDAAVARDVEPIEGPVVWGVDVARFGSDRTAVAKRMLNSLVEPVVSWAQVDLMQTTGRIVAMYEETRAYMRPKEICVDAIGIGAGVADRLREEGLPAKAVQVSEKPGIMERYLRERDELWFRAREWFDSREVTMPEDAVLQNELATVRYSFSSSGKLRVETKDEMRKRGLRSPDLADAFILTFAAAHAVRWGAGTARGGRTDRPLPTKSNSAGYSPHRWRRREAPRRIGR